MEYNWRCDPEAACAVLAGLNRVITLLPEEICVESSLSWVCDICLLNCVTVVGYTEALQSALKTEHRTVQPACFQLHSEMSIRLCCHVPMVKKSPKSENYLNIGFVEPEK